MGRKNRITRAGTHHVSNRGVGLRDIFNNHEDKAFFISTLCKLTLHYDFNIHSFALIPNGYNLLIETKRDNLSLIMQILNTRYAHHFNKKHGRRGHLWENRFKSWYIKDNAFLLSIVAYIEYLPIHNDATRSKDKYLYSSYRQFVGQDKRLSCIENSIVFQTFNSVKEIEKFFSKKIDLQKINSLHESFTNENGTRRPKKNMEIKESYFKNIRTKLKRNEQIVKAYSDGHSQASIAKVIGISQQAVHKIVHKSFRHPGKTAKK